MIKVEKLNPFGRMCVSLGMLPSSYKESLTYEEQLLWFMNYLENTVIPAVNNNAEALEELQALYIEIKTYVDNYFENLNVQEEINNKLDAMVLDGTFDEIINQELFSDINQRLTLLDTKKIVLIGDSYLEGYTPDGSVTSWGTLFKNYLGLSNAQVIVSYLGGSSFAGTKPFSDLVDVLSADNDVTDVIVAGGYNDRTYNRSQILTGMTTFKTSCATRFPNAKIWCAMIGWSSASDQLYNLYNTTINYQINASKLGIGFMNGTQYSLKNYFAMFSSDGIHPNSSGQDSIARSLVNSFINGYASVIQPYTTSTITPSGSCTGTNTGSSSISTILNNNIVQITCAGVLDYIINSVSYTANGKNEIEVGTLAAGYIVGSNYKITNCPVNLIIHDTTDGKYYKESGILTFKNGKVYISFAAVNDEGSNYRSFTTINQIQVCPFSCIFDATFC